MHIYASVMGMTLGPQRRNRSMKCEVNCVSLGRIGMTQANMLEAKTELSRLVKCLKLSKRKLFIWHRILICQASAESMFFVAHDSLIPGYNEPCILAI